MKKHLLSVFFLMAGAFTVAAQTQEELLGNLPMGIDEAWTGKVLFNSEGGYNGNWNTDENPIHGWSPLFEAGADDVYTISFPTPTRDLENGRVQFKTPINIYASHKYTLKITVRSLDNDAYIDLMLGENEGPDKYVYSTDVMPRKTNNLVINNIQAIDIDDMRLQLKIGTALYDTHIELSGISLYDETEGKELWIGTSYYNWCYYANEWGNRIEDMAIEGRVETNSWTLPDFDDSMWSEEVMPVGNDGYWPSPNTTWPGENNTNYWIRRTFELAEVNRTTKYTLRVLHDDSYWIYVNGNLVDTDMGWTEGNKAAEIEVPYEYLRVGKNVIATYIRQNWGGKFFDCGMTAELGAYEFGDDDADVAGSIILNEVTVANIDQILDYSNNYGGWIEVYNQGDKRVDLSGLYISNDPAQLDMFQLPKNYGVVAPGGYKCIFFGNHPTEPGPYVEQEYFVETAYK